MAPARGAQWQQHTAQRMANERHYFLVGLFVLGGMLAILFFSIWLTSRDDSQYRMYRIKFAESVSGLSNGSDVKFRGVKVGVVKEIAIDPDDARLIRVDIWLLKTTPVKTNTKAALKMQGITGTVFVELSGGGDPRAPDLVNENNKNRIPEITAEQSSLNAVIDRVPLLLDKISNAVDRINQVLSDDNIAAASHMIQNGDAAMGDLRTIAHGSRDSIRTTAESAASAMKHLERAASRADSLSERIDENPSSLLFPSDDTQGIPAP